MRPLSKKSFQTGAAVLIATLLLALFAVLPARADVVLDPYDPAVTARYSSSLLAGTSNGGAQTGFSWSYTSGLVQDTSSHYVSFLNNTGVDWTTLEITAHYTPTTGHTFIAYTARKRRAWLEFGFYRRHTQFISFSEWPHGNLQLLRRHGCGCGQLPCVYLH